MCNKGSQFYVEVCVRAVMNKKRAVNPNPREVPISFLCEEDD